MSREATNKLLELVDDGIIERDKVILACLNYMSEADVADMCHREEFFGEEDDEDGESD